MEVQVAPFDGSVDAYVLSFYSYWMLLIYRVDTDVKKTIKRIWSNICQHQQKHAWKSSEDHRCRHEGTYRPAAVPWSL